MRLPFPWVALGVGLLLAVVLLNSGAMPQAGERSLPLLTQLIVAEFGFFLTAIGAVMAMRTIMTRGFTVLQGAGLSGCVLLAAGFLWLGLQLWPAGGS